MRWPWLLQWRLSGRRYRLHWSLPVGALGAWLLWPSTDTVLGYLLLIAAHHAGHRLLARRGGLSTTGMDLHALGGDAHHKGKAPRLRHVLAGAGGVLGQLLLLWLTLLVVAVAGLSSDTDLYRALTTLNLGLMALNLLPVSGTDASALWALPGALVARLEEKLTYLQIQEVEAKRASWQEMIDRDQAGSPLAGMTVPSEEGAASPSAPLDFEALLAEQDARADEGITEALAGEVSALLAGVWGGEE